MTNTALVITDFTVVVVVFDVVVCTGHDAIV